jgi:site-specific DNA-methyltransferase (adenine-specific)
MNQQIVYKRVNELIPYARNSRTHSDEQISQIMASIKEFGFTNPILTDGANGIIAGHGRILASQRLGIEEVPTIELSHLTEAQKKAYIIADNKLALNSGWDEELLAIEMQELYNGGFDVDLIGFTMDELLEMDIDLGAGIDPVVDESKADEVPEVVDNPVIKLGDLIELGNHRLMCGDSTKEEDVKRLMDGELADQLVTDPPYNVSYEGKTKDALKIQNDSMDDVKFRLFLADAFKAADSVMKQGAVFYIWHADSEGYNFRGACRDAGWKVRQNIIWKKQTMVMGRQDYHWQHEPCLYGWKDGAGHLWNSDRKQTTILEFNRPMRNDIHPTMKPVDLIEYNISNNTKGQDVVLDLFGGSGTTMIACENLSRKARLMELDEKYAQVIVQRWCDYTQIYTIKINGAEVSWSEYKGAAHE